MVPAGSREEVRSQLPGDSGWEWSGCDLFSIQQSQSKQVWAVRQAGESPPPPASSRAASYCPPRGLRAGGAGGGREKEQQEEEEGRRRSKRRWPA